MAGDTHRRTVGEYVTLVRGTTYKGQLVGEPGPALLGLGSIEPGGGFRIGNYKTYGGDCPDELMLFPGDIYASLKGATKDGKMIGSVARVPASVPTGRLTQDTVKLVFRNPNTQDASYLHWILRSPQYRDYCAGHAMGSAVVALSRRDFLSYPVPPPTPPRRRVVTLLDAVEHKIELNRRMNETLEAMARALFKSWFVDFDPVRAKAEGRDPGLPQLLADLFPDSFEDSELGEIPKGWEVTTLSELCSTQYGYTASAVDEPIGPKLLRVTDINKRNWIEWAEVPHCAVEPKARESYALGVGDLVVARMADPGKSAIIEDEVDAVFASYLVRLKTASLANSYYVYGFLKSDRYAEYAAGAKSGSVQANMNARVIVGASLVVPSTSVVEQFLHAVLPFRQRLAASVRESRTLAALRDTLLPRLLSGELRVRYANDSIQEATS